MLIHRLRHSSLRRWASSATNHHAKVPYNEPGGEFLAASSEQVDWARRIYIVGYLGGLTVFAFLWQYKPDTSAEAWARQEALRRMSLRGVNLSELDE